MLVRFLLGLLVFFVHDVVHGQIHDIPILIKGNQLTGLDKLPVESIRLFSTDAKGNARVIPFQVDEFDSYGDFVLNYGPKPNSQSGNGLLDARDELVFMGNDTGTDMVPQNYPGSIPDELYRIIFKNRVSDKQGTVFLGIYQKSVPPPLSDQSYVVFDLNQQLVSTSRYRYVFDRENYLILKEVSSKGENNSVAQKILSSSTFYMNADLKYFFTVSANHRTVNSKLEAYKTGPIRSVVRVEFSYSFLKLNFDVGMYTELSFFSNSIEFPAVFFSPIDGKETLNNGSQFYYGFALNEGLASYKLDTNMTSWQDRPKNGLFSFGSKAGNFSNYWLSLIHPSHMVYLSIQPSSKMRKDGVTPLLYQSPKPWSELSKISNEDIHPIEQAPINLGVAFDLTKFASGENTIGFKLFFENYYSPEKIKTYKDYKSWYFEFGRVSI